jgi:hypothetical protein
VFSQKAMKQNAMHENLIAVEYSEWRKQISWKTCQDLIATLQARAVNSLIESTTKWSILENCPT